MSNQSPHDEHMTTPPKRTRQKPTKEVDHKYPFPQPYFCFNPQLFDDENWKLRDLQKLCKTLSVQVQDYDERYLSPDSKQKIREVYIKELQTWHKTPIRQGNSRHIRRKGTTNFALLQVEVPDGTTGNAQELKHDPKLLTPLRNKPRRRSNGAPVSILREKCPQNDMRTTRSPARKLAIKEGTLFSPSDPRHEKRNIKMSIFNGAKIIPPKPAIFDDWLNEAGVSYDTESDDSDVFMSPAKEHINRFYDQHQTPQQQQHQQHQQQQQQQRLQQQAPTTPVLGPQPQQHKSIGFSCPSPASSVNSDAGSTPMKSAKMRQPTPAVKKQDQPLDFDDDDDDDFELPEELDEEFTPTPTAMLSPTPEETPKQPIAVPTPTKSVEFSGPMTRRRSLAAQSTPSPFLQQPQQMHNQSQQQGQSDHRPKPLTRASITRSQQTNNMQHQQYQSQPHAAPQMNKTRQQKITNPEEQELVNSMGALSL